MKKLVLMLLVLGFMMGALPRSLAGGPPLARFEQLPQEMQAFQPNGYGFADGILVEGGVAYLLFFDGTYYTLTIIKQDAQGAWQKVVSSNSAIPGDGAGWSLTSDVPDKVYIQTSENHYLTYREQKGVWKLAGYSDITADKETHIAYEDDSITFSISTNGAAAKTTRVYGVYQRDLRYINIRAVPFTVADARKTLSQAPDIPAGELTARRIKFTSGQKFPVYSGPGEHYLRSAGGRAVVSTNDWIQVFGVENGWAMIQYDISSDHMRIGFIDASALPGNAGVGALALGSVPMMTNSAVTLTDDPLFSKAVLARLPQGQSLRSLSSMGAWAYVEAEISGGPVRGFVPAVSLAPAAPLIPQGEYSVRGEFAAYSASAVMNRTADGAQRVITVYVEAPAGLAPAQGADFLTGYQLYENNRPGPALAQIPAPAGLLAYSVTVADDPQVTVLGLTPRYSQSGERPGEALVMIVQ